MKPLILALATALPQYSADQISIAQNISAGLRLTQNESAFIHKIYASTEIKRRYSVLPDIQTTPDKWTFLGTDYPPKIPSTQVRNEIYKKEAPKLALQAVQKLLAQWPGDKQEITHVISVSCTGVMAPGIEFLLAQALGLNPDVQLVGINMMGCFGAFTGLLTAAAFAQQDPAHRILLVCTELCSLHFQVDARPEVLIANALFGDGAAAVLVGCEPRVQERPLFSLEKSISYALKDTAQSMTWSISDTGFAMELSKEIPNAIKEHVVQLVKRLVPLDQFKESIWAVHPGGKKILEVIEAACGLDSSHTQASWSVLANYGNMSSATFLFVLAELLQKSSNKPIIGLGFGPGLSCKGLLVKQCSYC